MESDAANEPRRFIVQARHPEKITDIIQAIKSLPETELLDEIGPTDRPQILIVRAPLPRLQTLQQKFPGEITIEQDQKLSLENKDGDGGGANSGTRGQDETDSGGGSRPTLRQ